MEQMCFPEWMEAASATKLLLTGNRSVCGVACVLNIKMMMMY